MRTRIPLALVLALPLAACAGGSAGPAGLAFGVPSPAAVSYVTGDTVNMDLDVGGQAMQVRVNSGATLGATFRRQADGVQATLEVKAFSANLVNPMASASADASGISGPLVMNMDRRGAVTMVSEPQVTEAASQFFQPLTLAHGLFPRLPGRAAGVGESWTDTIRYEGAQGPGTVSSVSVATYTVSGDTVVDGRSLVKISFEATVRADGSGVTTGMDFTQTTSSTETGWVLWDQQRGLMVERFTESDGRGNMNVSAAPFPLGLRVRGRAWVKLHPGG